MTTGSDQSSYNSADNQSTLEQISNNDHSKTIVNKVVATQQYCLKWNDFHTNVSTTLSQLRGCDALLDVSLVAQKRTIKAHKLILSSCSPFLRDVLRGPSEFCTTPGFAVHPVVYLCGAKYDDVLSILTFMYEGEVNVGHDNLPSFLTLAEELRVRGLSDKIESKQQLNQNTINACSAQSQEHSTTPKYHESKTLGKLSDKPPQTYDNKINETFHESSVEQSQVEYFEADSGDSEPQPHLSIERHDFDSTPSDDCSPSFIPDNENNLPSGRNDSASYVTVNDYDSTNDDNSMLYVDKFPPLNKDSQDVLLANAETVYHHSGKRHNFKGMYAVANSLLQSGLTPEEIAQEAIPKPYSVYPLGGRDSADPLSQVMVAHSRKGWHCPQCLHVSTTKGNLKSHILSGRHKLLGKSFPCQYCQKTYSTRQSLQVHISTNHRYEREIEYQDLSNTSTVVLSNHQPIFLPPHPAETTPPSGISSINAVCAPHIAYQQFSPHTSTSYDDETSSLRTENECQKTNLVTDSNNSASPSIFSVLNTSSRPSLTITPSSNAMLNSTDVNYIKMELTYPSFSVPPGERISSLSPEERRKRKVDSIVNESQSPQLSCDDDTGGSLSSNPTIDRKISRRGSSRSKITPHHSTPQLSET